MNDNSIIVRRFVDLVLNKDQIDSAGQFFWEDMVEQVLLPGQGPGLGGLKDVLRGMRAAFPDMHWTVEEQIAEGDKVATRFEWTGTHRGEFLGVPATGRAGGFGAWSLTGWKAERSRTRVLSWIA